MCGILFNVLSHHPQSCWKLLLCQMLQLQLWPLFSSILFTPLTSPFTPFTPSPFTPTPSPFIASPLTPLTHLYQHIIISKLFPFLLLLRPFTCSIFSQATLNPAQIERKKNLARIKHTLTQPFDTGHNAGLRI